MQLPRLPVTILLGASIYGVSVVISFMILALGIFYHDILSVFIFYFNFLFLSIFFDFDN